MLLSCFHITLYTLSLSISISLSIFLTHSFSLSRFLDLSLSPTHDLNWKNLKDFIPNRNTLYIWYCQGDYVNMKHIILFFNLWQIQTNSQLYCLKCYHIALIKNISKIHQNTWFLDYMVNHFIMRTNDRSVSWYLYCTILNVSLP